MDVGTNLYPESTTHITEIEATGVQLKSERGIKRSTALTYLHRVEDGVPTLNLSVRGSTLDVRI